MLEQDVLSPIEELLLLIFSPENQPVMVMDQYPLIEYLAELQQQAKIQALSDTEAMEYVCTRLFGQMHIPSGKTNYYLKQLDQLSYSEEEVRCFQQVVAFMSEGIPSINQLRETSKIKIFETRSLAFGQSKEFEKIDSNHILLYENFQKTSFGHLFRNIHLLSIYRENTIETGLLFECILSPIYGVLEKQELPELFSIAMDMFQKRVYRELVPVFYRFWKNGVWKKQAPAIWFLDANISEHKDMSTVSVSVFVPEKECFKKGFPELYHQIIESLIKKSLTERLKTTGSEQ